MSAEPAFCRSCHSPIVWAISPNGSNMPIDATPAALVTKAPQDKSRGVVGYAVDWTPTEYSVPEPPRLISRGMFLFAANVTQAPMLGAEPIEPEVDLHVSHFATCPNAGWHSKRGSKR